MAFRFFLFTDWQSSNAQGQGLAEWAPFERRDKADATTLGEIKDDVNKSLDGRLAKVVLPENRVYFSHLNRGVELIESGSQLQWKFLQGAIVEPDSASTQRGHGEALDRLAYNLSANAPDFLKSKVKILVCVLPGAGIPVDERFEPADAFKFRHPLRSKELTEFVCDWLTHANKEINDDRRDAPKEIREAVDKFFNENLG